MLGLAKQRQMISDATIHSVTFNVLSSISMMLVNDDLRIVGKALLKYFN
jgi:hypothetical protein